MATVIKLENHEVTSLKMFKESIDQANAALNGYTTLLAKKYELPAGVNFSISQDLSSIVEMPKPPAPPAIAAPAAPAAEVAAAPEQK